MEIGDKVTCRPDGKVRGCKVIDIEENRVKVKWLPGPQTKWMSKANVVPSRDWNRSNDKYVVGDGYIEYQKE